MSTSSHPSMQMSDPSVPVTSVPSLRTMRRKSRILQVTLILFAVLAVVALVFTGVLFKEKKREAKESAVREQEAAWTPKRLNVQAVSMNEFDREAGKDETLMHFSLFTTPAGAEVYRDGVFMGNTPIEEMTFPKENKSSNIVIVHPGYEITRKTVSMSENFSVAVQLREQTVQQAKTKAPKAEEGVTANQAIMITTQENDSSKKGKKNGKKAESEQAPANDIVLPD